MPDPRIAPPVAGGPLPVKSAGCPAVADLLNYALGHSASDDRQRIETHLHQSNCCDCRRWIDNATRQRSGQTPVDLGKIRHLAGFPPPQASPPHPMDQTPIPESSKWQRQAFQELERRLHLLEESD